MGTNAGNVGSGIQPAREYDKILRQARGIGSTLARPSTRTLPRLCSSFIFYGLGLSDDTDIYRIWVHSSMNVLEKKKKKEIMLSEI